MVSGPLTPPSVAVAGRALAPVAPERIAWPTVFDDATTVERAWTELVAGRGERERLELRRALAFARARHGDQCRRGSRSPYWIHPVRVALALARWGEGTTPMLVAALLHDTVEDTETSLGEIRAGFGPTVAELVAWLTAPPPSCRAELRAYYGRLRREAPARVVILKLADRADNLRSIQALVMRTGDEFRAWAGGYLHRTRRHILPMAARAPSAPRVALVMAMADLAPLVVPAVAAGTPAA